MSHHEDGRTQLTYCIVARCQARLGMQTWKMVPCFKTVSRLPEAQILFKQDVSIVDLDYCLLIALKWKLLICVRGQSAVVSQISVTGPKDLSRGIFWRYCGCRWRTRGQVQLLFWVLGSTQTQMKPTCSYASSSQSCSDMILFTHTTMEGPNQSERLPLAEGPCEVCLENVFVPLQSKGICRIAKADQFLRRHFASWPPARALQRFSVFSPSSSSLYWICPRALDCLDLNLWTGRNHSWHIWFTADKMQTMYNKWCRAQQTPPLLGTVFNLDPV